MDFYSALSHRQGWPHHKINSNLYTETSKIINYIVIILYSSHTHTHACAHTHWHMHTQKHYYVCCIQDGFCNVSCLFCNRFDKLWESKLLHVAFLGNPSSDHTRHFSNWCDLDKVSKAVHSNWSITNQSDTWLSLISILLPHMHACMHTCTHTHTNTRIYTLYLI